MRKNLYFWQDECLKHWLAGGGRGIVNVVTGAGKTVLALAAVEALKKTLPALRVYIVVPKTFLITQWARSLRDELDIPRGDIGCFSGSRKDPPDRAFMIYVVNSARYAIARSIVSDFQASRPVLLIADECHHYGTAENARIFGFMEFIPNSGLYYSLGLSATPHSAYFKTVLVPALGNEMYRYGFNDALQEGIINPFTVFNIALAFYPDEREDYDAYTESLQLTLRRLKELCPYLRGVTGGAFFAQLQSLTAAKDLERAEAARNVLLLLYRRKDVIYRARERIGCVLSLVAHLPSAAKVIIFTERIETTEIIFNKIKSRTKGGMGISATGMYHSDMHERARVNTLIRFENGEIRVLVSCRALDEGFNVPEADVGIVVSSTNSDRQRIQRLGRILRKKGRGQSRLYYLYIEDSAEEMTLLHELHEGTGGLLREPPVSASGINEVPVIDMFYREDEGFISPYYDELASDAMVYVHSRNWSAERVLEVKRNIALGRVSCDWLLSEAKCREQVAVAETTAEKNYYVTMLLLIKERLKAEDGCD